MPTSNPWSLNLGGLRTRMFRPFGTSPKSRGGIVERSSLRDELSLVGVSAGAAHAYYKTLAREK